MKFNKQKFLALSREKNKFAKAGKLFLFDEFKNKELTKYLSLLLDYICWNNRKDYLNVCDSFVHKKISLAQFFDRFYSLRALNFQTLRIWETDVENQDGKFFIKLNETDFQLNPESEKFSEIISCLHSAIENSDFDTYLFLKNKFNDNKFNDIEQRKELFRREIEKYFLPVLHSYCQEP